MARSRRARSQRPPRLRSQRNLYDDCRDPPRAVPGRPPLSVLEIGGDPCVVSRTGWSGELGYEIYPLSSAGGLRIWRAVVEAGSEHDLLITGPNMSRALERGITDNAYYVNSGMNPYESGLGQEALRRAAATSPARATVGLVCDEGAQLPPLSESSSPEV